MTGSHWVCKSDRRPGVARFQRQAGAATTWVLLVIAVLVLGFVAWRWYTRAPHGAPAEQVPASATVGAAMDPAKASSAARYPVSNIVAETPSPAPAASAPMAESLDPRAALAALPQGQVLSRLLVPQNVIARIVATVNALPGDELASKILPVKPPDGSFRVGRKQDHFVIAASNAKRYAPYLQLAEDIDLETAVQWYVRHYPAFEHAYRQLGYPQGHFNDRLVAVIDHLLATPVPTRALEVVPAKGGWAYADADLEALSVGQRMLLRLPADERRVIRSRLRKLRGLLTHAEQTGVGSRAPAGSTTAANVAVPARAASI